MEVPTASEQEILLKRSEKLKIVGISYYEIEITSEKISATGKDWALFELNTSNIQAVWMGSQRKFSINTLIIGFIGALAGLYLFSIGFEMESYSTLYFSFPFLAIGGGMVAGWIVSYVEALIILLSSGPVQMEGSIRLLKDIYDVLTK